MTQNTSRTRQGAADTQERLLRKLRSLSSLLHLLRVLRDRQARRPDETGSGAS